MYVVFAGGRAGLTTGAASAIGARHWSVTRTAKIADSTRVGEVPAQKDWAATRW
jgi:hypothetical protein